jgi:uncharacterized Fe-S center protein
LGGRPPNKLSKLLDRTGFLDRLGCDDDVAIKVHMPEGGNVRGIRPVWVRAVISSFAEGKVTHLGLDTNITRECDCSNDPFALDRAMWDWMHEAPLYPGGPLDRIARDAPQAMEVDLDTDRAAAMWKHVGSRSFWEEIAPASRLGSLEYELETAE